MSHLDNALRGLAPRNRAGWRAVERVLADDEWHEVAELTGAAHRAVGLAARTVTNMVGNASSAGLLERRREFGVSWYRWAPVSYPHTDAAGHLIDTPSLRAAGWAP